MKPVPLARAGTVLSALALVLAGTTPAAPRASAAPLAVTAERRAEEEAAPGPLDDLDWLAGDWAGTVDGGHAWESHYTTPRGGVVLGASKELAGEELVMIEFERIFADAEGVWLAPYPHGEPSSARFRLVEHDAGEQRAAFEAPDHDFPRLLVYDRDGDRLRIDVRSGPEEDAAGFTLLLERR